MSYLLQPGDIVICVDPINGDHDKDVSLVVSSHKNDYGRHKVVVFENGNIMLYGAFLAHWEGWELLS
jgi:hypothetical protein